MIARFLGVRVWELPKVAAHYQHEAAIILAARHEAMIEKQNARIKAGAMTAEIFLPDF